MTQKIKSNFVKNLEFHIDLINKQKYDISKKIDKFSDLIIKKILSGGILYIAGNGGSAADSQHIATELTVRLAKNRKAIPAIALTTDTSAITAIGNDFSFDKIFSRQIEANVKSKDVLLLISTSGNSINIIQALKVAKKRKIQTLLLLGNNGGKAKKLSKYSIIVNSSNPSRVQEVHILIYHSICEILEQYFEKRKI